MDFTKIEKDKEEFKMKYDKLLEQNQRRKDSAKANFLKELKEFIVYHSVNGTLAGNEFQRNLDDLLDSKLQEKIYVGNCEYPAPEGDYDANNFVREVASKIQKDTGINCEGSVNNWVNTLICIKFKA